MAYTEWSMQGVEFVNCNCDWGCPCQFNALPSHGDCRAYTFVQIEKGRFGDTPLDGLRWGILASWPGPIHLGNGTFQAIVDERADARQRAALEAVAHGRETDPGSLIWQVFSTTVTEVLPTLFKPIELKIDVTGRTASVRVPGVIDGSAGSILNPVTGAPHRVGIKLPTGFEYSETEVVSGKAKTQGPIVLDFDGTHAHLSRIHWSTHGVVR
ncbi:MAG TPA: DUF1326 domain-containing protein [Steroidobacteraceae bacterium]